MELKLAVNDPPSPQFQCWMCFVLVLSWPRAGSNKSCGCCQHWDWGKWGCSLWQALFTHRLMPQFSFSCQPFVQSSPMSVAESWQSFNLGNAMIPYRPPCESLRWIFLFLDTFRSSSWPLRFFAVWIQSHPMCVVGRPVTCNMRRSLRRTLDEGFWKHVRFKPDHVFSSFWEQVPQFTKVRAGLTFISSLPCRAKETFLLNWYCWSWLLRRTFWELWFVSTIALFILQFCNATFDVLHGGYVAGQEVALTRWPWLNSCMFLL